MYRVTILTTSVVATIFLLTSCATAPAPKETETIELYLPKVEYDE